MCVRARRFKMNPVWIQGSDQDDLGDPYKLGNKV